MQLVNYSEFRQQLKTHLDNVINNHEMLIVPRGGDKSVVIISLEDYNALIETLHLTKSDNNRDRLKKALDRANDGISESHDLIDD